MEFDPKYRANTKSSKFQTGPCNKKGVPLHIGGEKACSKQRPRLGFLEIAYATILANSRDRVLLLLVLLVLL